MLEPEIAPFVAAVGAWYPANALARSPAEQRRVYERFAAAWTPASLPEGLVQEDAACHAPDGRAIFLRFHRPSHPTPSPPPPAMRRTGARFCCAAIGLRIARRAVPCCSFMAAASSSVRWTATR